MRSFECAKYEFRSKCSLTREAFEEIARFFDRHMQR